MKRIFAVTVTVMALMVSSGIASGVNSAAHAQAGEVQVSVAFPGLSNAHVYLHAADGVAGAAGGAQVASTTWKNDSATLVAAAGTYDLRVVHGPTSVVFDGVDCTTACSLQVPLSELTVSFAGLNNVHVYAHLADGAIGSYGQQLASATWQADVASLVFLPGTYDVRVVHGPVSTVLDGVDCSGAACAVTVPTKTLNASFPGLSNTHVYAHVSDGSTGTYGQQVLSSTWKAGATSMVLLEGVYDVRIVHGPASVVLDGIDCTASGPCQVEAPLATLTTNFPGLTNAHVYAHLTDGASGSYGQQVLSSTWKSDTTSMVLLRGVYDVRVVHGPTSVVIDDVDCTSGNCEVAVPLATLDVSFAGLTNAHMYVHVDDGIAESYGQQVASSTWKSDSTSFVLLAGHYDLRAVHGPMASVVDGIDCSSGKCAATVPLATLSASFAGKTNIHTYVHKTDDLPATYGPQTAASTWKSGSASFVLLRGVYDVRFVNGSESFVADGVDCTGPTCNVDYDAAIPVKQVEATPTPTSTATVEPTATPEPSATKSLAPVNAATITFLTASCSAESAMALAVTGGKDPKSADNGTKEAVPSDIEAYGCKLVRASYHLYLFGSSTADGTYLDAALTAVARTNANDDAWDGAASTIAAGGSFYAAPGKSAIRRFSIAEYKHPGSSWIGLPYLDLQCSTDGINNDNADGAGWNGAAFGAGQQVYCIYYFLDEQPEPTPTATPTVAPGETPTPVPTVANPGRLIKELHPEVQVDEHDGVVTWIIRPEDLTARIYVWDANAADCHGFGGALCGGIGTDGTPGTFDPANEDHQNVIVTQRFKVVDGQCEPVVNTVEWSTDPNALPGDRESLTVEYRCSGANALGWPLLVASFVMAVAVAWYISRRIQWQS